MKSIDMLGSTEQKQRWLPGLASVDLFGAFALTEPLHGSDSVGLGTTARRDGEEYVLDGEKRWIGNGTIADVLVVRARDTEDGQVKGFLVEGGATGLDARRMEGKSSLHAVWQTDLTFTGVRVPASDRLPGANRFADTARAFASTRNAVAWGRAGARDRGVRDRAVLQPAARAVRQAAGQLPAGAGQARAHAGGGDGHAAVLPTPGAAVRGGTAHRHDGLAGQAEQHPQGRSFWPREKCYEGTEAPYTYEGPPTSSSSSSDRHGYR